MSSLTHKYLVVFDFDWYVIFQNKKGEEWRKEGKE